MKSLLISLCLLTVATCGKKDSKPTKIVNALCAEGESKNCVLPTQFIIVSKKQLPKKIKVYFKKENFRAEALNQCDPTASIQLFPIWGVSMIGFRERSEVFEAGMGLEIVDAGESCDKDALFFDEVVIPVDSDSWQHTKTTKTFNLEN
ncbi:MAG TPA: hypothetical protein VNJ01_13365 [Bacteriovoracaceae bacterium]|nr:hypothetical protein [Bacteriovoracaceae bacterium]